MLFKIHFINIKHTFNFLFQFQKIFQRYCLTSNIHSTKYCIALRRTTETNESKMNTSWGLKMKHPKEMCFHLNTQLVKNQCIKCSSLLSFQLRRCLQITNYPLYVISKVYTSTEMRFHVSLFTSVEVETDVKRRCGDNFENKMIILL